MKKLLILSGKGGTGKTSTAAGFIAFSKAQAIADCDVDAPNLHLVLTSSAEAKKSDFIGSQKARITPSLCTNCKACQNHCRFNAIETNGKNCFVNPVRCEGCSVCTFVCPQKAVTMEDDISGQQFLFTENSRIFSTAKLKIGRGNSGKLVTAVKKSLFEKSRNADIAVIDGSPGIGCPVIASINGADLILIVAEPSSSGFNDLKRLVQTASSLQAAVCVCVNKWDINPQYTEIIKGFCKENNIPFTGTVPYDDTVSFAINEQRNIAEFDCEAAKALLKIYNNVMQILDIRHENYGID